MNGIKYRFHLKAAAICAAALVCFLFLYSCSGNSGSKTESAAVSESNAVPQFAAVPRSMAAAPAAYKQSYDSMQVSSENMMSASDIGTNAAASERKLIKNGSVDIEVENLASAAKSLETWCQSFGGYVSSSYEEEMHSSFTVRIPAVSFEQAMVAAGTLGTVKQRSISSEDVSDQYYDLETRLAAKKILRDRLQSYLSQAKDMKDMLQIERELNNTVSEIESMEGRMRRLSGQIDYSSITVSLLLPYRHTDSGFIWPEFGTGFRRFASNCIDFFAGFITVLLYIVVCGVPILAAAALLFWLLFGKVGLLKKLFKKLKP